MDVTFKQETEARRQAAIDRVTRTNFLQTEPVKALTSKILIAQVLQERELQIALKNSRNVADDYHDSILFQHTITNSKKDEVKERDLAMNKKLERVQLAQTHLAQAKEKRLKQHAEKQELLAYGHGLALQDQIYITSQASLAKQHKDSEILRKKALDDMRASSFAAREQQKKEDAEEDVKTQKWAVEQDRKSEKKKEIEEAWKQ